LNTFLREARLPPDAGEDTDGDGITVDKILSEKKLYDLTINFEKLGKSKDVNWAKPCEYHSLRQRSDANEIGEQY
jgi:hypothetical protein